MDSPRAPARIGAARRWSAVLTTAVLAVGVLAVTSPGPAGASVDHGSTTIGDPGIRRTTAQLAAAARSHPRPPHAPLPLRRIGAPSSSTPGSGVPTTAASTSSASALTDAFSFDGPDLLASTSPAFPPDTQGDVGPTQFFITLNTQFRTYTRTGTADGMVDMTPDAFFAPEMTGVSCNFTSDPHVRFDRLTQRWFVVMIDVPGCSGTQPNRIMVAVSDDSTISGSTTWTFHHVTAPAGLFADYPTLGIDASALYVGVNDFGTLLGTYSGSDGYVIRKSSLYVDTDPIISARFDVGSASGAGAYTPQGVDDPYGASAAGYFVGVDASKAFPDHLGIVRITDPGGTPSMTALSVPVNPVTDPLLVPHLDNNRPNNGRLDGLDVRLFAATMTADGHVWTAHASAMTSSGVASNSADRDGARWYELDPTAPSLVQSGTVFDPAASSPLFYWVPTLAVNGQGHLAIGGSVAGSGMHPSAWFASRLATGAPGTTSAPTVYAPGYDYNPPGDTGGTEGRRWGDYSLTRVDPEDDQTIWTIQEYADQSNSWGVKVARLQAPAPPTPSAASRAVPPGSTSTHVVVTGPAPAGQGWFDPGPGFPQRLQVAVGCGVVVTSATVVSPTALDLDLDTTAATLGTCAVTTTNPDGQTTSGSVLTVQTTPPPPPPPVAAYRTDALVKRSSASAYLGDGVYDLTGLGQTAQVRSRRHRVQTFDVAVQNDGTAADAFRLVGAGTRRGFKVHYYAGATDVTSQVLTGTYLTSTLAPGSSASLRLVVTVTRKATVGKTRAWLVRATSSHDTTAADTVKAKVKVVR